ncbi:MAG: hypothetical protein K2M98_04035, partial [Muribaculum sp.]|nr:hypothetical protein [Muribaculum sp.]
IIGRSCWLAKLCSRNFSKQLIAVSSDGLAIIGKDEDGKKSCGYSPMSGIEEWLFVRKHWYSLVSALWISGDYDNIRKDQVAEFSGYVTGLWICKRRKIKSLLESECSDAYVEEKDRRKEIKQIIFNPVNDGKDSLAAKAAGSAGKKLLSNILKG